MIHTVGPVWRGGASAEAGRLAACYRSALTLATDDALERVLLVAYDDAMSA